MSVMVLTLSIVFCAALVKATLGFGESLVAMPLLTLTIGLHTATPIVGWLGLLVTFCMLGPQWRKLEFRTTGTLLAAAVCGLPVGLLLVHFVPAPIASRLLGVVLIGYGAFSLWRPVLVVSPHPVWTYSFGFLAGVLGSAYNVSGPPMVVYAALRGWSPAYFRRTLQGFFLPVSVLIVLSQGMTGLWSWWVLMVVVLALPLCLVAAWLGEQLQRHISVRHFTRAVSMALIILGCVLLG